MDPFLAQKALNLKCGSGSSHCGSVVMNLKRINDIAGLIPGLVQWGRIRNCCERWCRLQSCLGFGVAVAVACSCSSNWTPSLGTSMCHGCSLKKKKGKKALRNQHGCPQRWPLSDLTNVSSSPSISMHSSHVPCLPTPRLVWPPASSQFLLFSKTTSNTL